MSAPVVVSVDPGNSETDVVLGQALIVTFDQVIDPTTLNDSTFSLTYPASIQVVNASQLISGKPESSTVAVDGTWSLATVAGATVATFQPTRGFQQNTPYTAMLLGADASLSTEDLKNLAGESMAVSYQWTFTTGVLDLLIPPSTSPLVDDNRAIQLDQIRIVPRIRLNQDLTQEFDVIFPGDIDPTSFDVSDIYLSVEAILGNPLIPGPPPNLEYSATVDGNKLRIRVTGWPA
jgi:hypothetical protein